MLSKLLNHSFLAAALLLGIAISPAFSQDTGASKTEEKWIQLFNGKDLEGWTPKIRYHDVGVNHANTFRVEDGILKVGYDGYSDLTRLLVTCFTRSRSLITDCESNIALLDPR